MKTTKSPNSFTQFKQSTMMKRVIRPHSGISAMLKIAKVILRRVAQVPERKTVMNIKEIVLKHGYDADAIHRDARDMLELELAAE